MLKSTGQECQLLPGGRRCLKYRVAAFLGLAVTGLLLIVCFSHASIVFRRPSYPPKLFSLSSLEKMAKTSYPNTLKDIFESNHSTKPEVLSRHVNSVPLLDANGSSRLNCGLHFPSQTWCDDKWWRGGAFDIIGTHIGRRIPAFSQLQLVMNGQDSALSTATIVESVTALNINPASRRRASVWIKLQLTHVNHEHCSAFGISDSISAFFSNACALLGRSGTCDSSIGNAARYSYLHKDKAETNNRDSGANNRRPEVTLVEAIGRSFLILCYFCCACLLFYHAVVANNFGRFFGLVVGGFFCLWVCFSVFYTWLFGFREWFRM